MKKNIGIILIITIGILAFFFVQKKTILAPSSSSTGQIVTGVEIIEYSLVFPVPTGRTLAIAPNRLSTIMHFRLGTQYKDTKGYQVFIDVTVARDLTYKDQIKEYNGITGTIPNGKTMPLFCDGFVPMSCTAIYANGASYFITANAMTLRPGFQDKTDKVIIKDSNEVSAAIERFIAQVQVSK